MRSRIPLLFLIALLAFACKGKVQEPSTDFAEYISAFTGGTVGSDVPIKIEFAQKVKPGVPADDLLTISPSLKGQAFWDREGNLVFYHSSLEQGKTYMATLDLNKLFDLSKTDLRHFSFSFRAGPRILSLSIDGVSIQTEDVSKASVSGTVLFSEVPANASDILTYTYEGETSSLELSPGDGNTTFSFCIKDLDRKDEARPLTFAVNPASSFNGTVLQEALIPGREGFSIVDAKIEGSSEPYVMVEFSQPLDASQDLDGLLMLSDFERTILQREDNIVRIYFETAESEVSLFASADIRSSDGRSLGTDYKSTFSVSEPFPAARIPVEGTIVPDPTNVILPFRTVNLSAVDIQVIRIFHRNVLSFLQTSDLDQDWQLRRSGRLVYKKHVELPFETGYHKWHDWSVDLNGIIKQEPDAIYRVRITFCRDYSLYGKKEGSEIDRACRSISSANEMTDEEQAVWDRQEPYIYYDDYGIEQYSGCWEDSSNPEKDAYYLFADFPSINVLASNLGIIYKADDGKTAWVAVSDINTAQPVANAEVVMYNFQLQEVARAVTDAEGFARTSLKGKPFIVTAKKNGKVSYLKVGDGEENSTSRFDTGGQKVDHGLKAYAYGERGVWRPGDTLHLALLVDGKLPENHPVAMEVYTPSDNLYCKQIGNSSLNGFYTFDLPTDPSDPTGKWHVWFKVGGASFRKDVNIETVKPNRLKINLEVPEVLQKSQPVEIRLQSSWLTGAVASSLESTIELSFRRNLKPFKGYEGYSFDCNPSVVSSEPAEYSQTLDQEGKASYQVNVPGPDNAPGMMTADLLCRVMEPGGGASFVTQTVPFSPFSSYVGVKSPAEAPDEYLETDRDHEFPIVVLDASGKAVSGAAVEYKVFKMKWSWWWESHSQSLDSYINGLDAKEVAGGKITSGTSASTVRFRVDYPEWGRYIFYARDLQSGHTSALSFLVDWPQWRGRSDKRDPDAVTMITFSTDKKEYEAGEQATVYIPACADGKALVSIENGSGVLSRSWVNTRADGDTPFKFTVTEGMAPNIYVHLTLLQPYGKSSNDLPLRLYGVQPVTVTCKASHLEPVIKVPEVLRPQEKFSVKVSEKSGRPMTYTLAIVDEGLLDITGFKTPDPWSRFNMKEALGVRTWDLYDDVMGAYAGRLSSVLSIGGDENSVKKSRADNRFNPVVRFLGPFTLSKGENVHNVTLPLYVGSVRVMVVAGMNGAYGNAEKTVPVRTPLMVLPTLPRVISCTENVVLPVNVFAMEDDVKRVKVSLKVEDQTSVYNTTEDLTFDKPGDKLVNFKVKAGDKEGTLKATITAVAGAHKVCETICVEVRNPHPPVTEIFSCTIPKGGEKTFEWTPFASDSDNYVKAEYSSFPSVDWTRACKFALSYPYDCTEQLASTGLTLLCAKAWVNDAQIDARINAIIRELYARQSSNGGFPYWPGRNYGPAEWVTSLAGQFLVTAASKGFDVDTSVLAAWKNYQKKCVRNYRHSDNDPGNDLVQAFRLYTLALSGTADSGAMNRLRETGGLGVAATLRLAACYALAGKTSVAAELASSVEGRSEEPASETFGSVCRDKAMTLETFVLMGETGKALSLAPDVVRMLSDNYSTQNVAFSSLALSRLSEKLNTGILDLSIDDGTTIKSVKSHYVSDLDSRTGTLKVKNNSEGEVYASVVKVSHPLAGEQVKASESGLTIAVDYCDSKDNPVSLTRIRQGDDVYASITVTNTSAASDYDNLALSMSVPSGWEIFNERLMTGGEEESYKDIRDDSIRWYFSLSAGQSKVFKARFQASYEGDFILPSVRCEDMYDTRVYANTASAVTKVIR